MRLWVRIAGDMAVLSTVPLVLSTLRTAQISTTQATRDHEAILARDAGVLAHFVETWTADQVQALAGWMQLVPLENRTFAQHDDLLSSIYVALPSVVSVVMVDERSVPTVAPRFLEAPSEPGTPLAGRIVGTVRRATDLIDRIPVAETLAKRGKVAVGAVGDPYLPEGETVASIPVGVTGPFGESIVIGAEITLGSVEALLLSQSSVDRVVVMLDRAGNRILHYD